jgi:hypothetical protein
MINLTKSEPTDLVVQDKVTSIADPMLSMIERVVLDPNASIEKLERMLAMKERLEDRALEESRREQERAYYRAFADCQQELRVVARNKKNTQTSSRYADLAAISEAADPVIRKHGFSTSFQPAGNTDKGNQLIKWRIAHRDGYVESGVAELPKDNVGAQGKVNKTDMHAFGSGATYGRRYLKLMLFDIATADDDGNAAGGDGPISTEQVDELIRLADEMGVDKAKFCETFEINGLNEIRVSELEKAKANMRLKQRYKNADR